MAPAEPGTAAPPPVEEIQRQWSELVSRVGQLEAERGALQQENKTLRTLVERVIEHRQKSHNELILLLTGLVSKLPLNDIGVIVSKLVEHNTSVNQFLGALAKGTAELSMPEPVVLKTLDQTRRELTGTLKPLVAELLRLETPLEAEVLQSFLENPDAFFSPRAVRGNRCFIKGQVPRERVLREFGDQVLALFNDMTTDAKLNPRPKPDEIVLAFKPEAGRILQEDPALGAAKHDQLVSLYERVQRSRTTSEHSRAQRSAFQKLSFLLELLHYYEHQNTESPGVIFAQRLPALIEQLVLPTPQDTLDEKHIVEAEQLLAHIIHTDHRHMVVNNVGKGDSAAKTLKYVLKLREPKVEDTEQVVTEFVRHLVPLSPGKPPTAEGLAAIGRLIHPEMRRPLVRALMHSDRLRKSEAEALGKAVAKALDLGEAEQIKAPPVSAEVERQMAWGKVKDLIGRRTDATSVANAIRERLHAKYDADEIRQSWIVLTEADPMSLIRVFCQLPYLPGGKTDPIARTVMEIYITRLMHEKYAATYHKVVNSLKSMYRAKPDSPTLVNFLALVGWVSTESSTKLAADVGMSAVTH